MIRKLESRKQYNKEAKRHDLSVKLVRYFGGSYKKAYESLVDSLSDDEFISSYKFIVRVWGFGL